MSRLEELVGLPDAIIVTAELPMIDTGGFPAVQRHLDQLTPWVDAINATDNTAAHAHASNVAMAVAMAKLGAEPIMQVVCRDKNRLALQADIVGASMFGVENICCLTGDDVTAGDEPEARRVFDLDGPQLVRVATGIGEGHYLSGRVIDPAPALFVGAVENPYAPPLDYRVGRAVKKSENGARFLQLQIGYHADRLKTFVAGCVAAGITDRTALLPTICLVKTPRALSFMDANVPGIAVPAAVIGKVADAADPNEATYQLALDQARHALSLPGVAGIHLADFRHDGSVARIVDDLGLRTHQNEEQHAHGSQLAG